MARRANRRHRLDSKQDEQPCVSAAPRISNLSVPIRRHICFFLKRQVISLPIERTRGIGSAGESESEGGEG